MRAQELRDMSNDELIDQTKSLKESIFRLRFKVSLGEMSALSNYRQAKKDLARVKTVMRERELKMRS